MMVHCREKKKQTASCFQKRHKNESWGVAKTRSALENHHNYVIWSSALHRTYLRTQDADKSLTRPTSRCILFDGENISFDASLVIYINSSNIPPIMIINRIYETQNLLSL
jgi:hypothetical protein